MPRKPTAATSKDIELGEEPTDVEREEEASATTGDAQEDNVEGNGPFGGLSPAEAGRRSAAARKEAAVASGGDTTSDAAIIRKLRAKAGKGDVPAARELREWQSKDADSDAGGDEWLALLTTEERALVRDLLRHVRARKLGQVEGEWYAVSLVATHAPTGGQPSASAVEGEHSATDPSEGSSGSGP